MRTRSILAFASLLFAFAVACSSSSSSSNDNKSAEQSNGECPTNPVVLKGTKKAGESCSSATECEPTCCSCTNGAQKSWLASACTGTCAPSAACAKTTDDARYCGQ